jgi:hypothetical protein
MPVGLAQLDVVPMGVWLGLEHDQSDGYIILFNERPVMQLDFWPHMFTLSWTCRETLGREVWESMEALIHSATVITEDQNAALLVQSLADQDHQNIQAEAFRCSSVPELQYALSRAKAVDERDRFASVDLLYNIDEPPNPSDGYAFPGAFHLWLESWRLGEAAEAGITTSYENAGLLDLSESFVSRTCWEFGPAQAREDASRPFVSLVLDLVVGH